MDTSAKIFENLSVEELEKFKKVINTLIDEELQKRTSEQNNNKNEKSALEAIKDKISAKIISIKEAALEIKNKVATKFYESKDKIITKNKEQLDELKKEIAEARKSFQNFTNNAEKKLNEVYDKSLSAATDVITQGISIGKSVKGKLITLYNAKEALKIKAKEKVLDSKNKVISLGKEKIELIKKNISEATSKIKSPVQAVKEKATIMAYNIQIEGLNLGISAKKQAIKIYNAKEALKTKAKEKVLDSKNKVISLSKEKVELIKRNISEATSKIKAPVQAVKEKATIMAYNIQIEGLNLGISAKKQAIKIYNAAEALKTKTKDKVLDKKEKILTFTSDKITMIKQGIKKVETTLSTKAAEVKQTAQEKIGETKQAAQETVQAIKAKGQALVLPAVKFGKTVKNQTIILYNAASNLKTKAKDKACEAKDKVMTIGKEKSTQIKEGIKNAFTPTPEKIQELQQIIEARKGTIRELKDQFANIGYNDQEVATGMSR